MIRTHLVAETSTLPEGTQVILAGWVHRRRDHGPILFIDLRNRRDLLQVVVRLKDFSEEEQQRIKDIVRPEAVLQVNGTIAPRKAGSENPQLKTGKIELVATAVTLMNAAEIPPFEIEKDSMSVGEEIRLKYRYLDLRTDRMQKNLMLRTRVMHELRQYFREHDFMEVETPYLSKSTPEGARDYLVPDRRRSGSFYALPQSPQQYKQLLMVSGIDRYYQIVRCFRDEDSRGDRQPEFTQLDVEMSFVDQEDVLKLIEELFLRVVETLMPEKRILEVPFPRISYHDAMKQYGTDRPDFRKDPNDPNELAFGFVLDFPMYERLDDGSLSAVHHPFTKPRVKSVEELRQQDPLTILADQYDLVLNGFEIAGGSTRAHDPAILAASFEVLGHAPEDVRAKFGHLLEAFTFGVPPHGGFACGLDRFIMALAGEPSIREVIAFPKTGDGRDLMMDAPSQVDEKQLKELHLKIVP